MIIIKLHAAVVELVAHERAHIFDTQLFKTGMRVIKKEKGGYIILLQNEDLCLGNESKISWTQVETGSAVTWKYPSCLLVGNQFTRGILFSSINNKLPTS